MCLQTTKSKAAVNKKMSDINGNELSAKKFLRLDNLSPAVKNLQYAVRGKIVIRAGELEKELKQVSCPRWLLMLMTRKLMG